MNQTRLSCILALAITLQSGAAACCAESVVNSAVRSGHTMLHGHRRGRVERRSYGASCPKCGDHSGFLTSLGSVQRHDGPHGHLAAPDWRIGLSNFDREFIPPRFWHIENLWQGWTSDTIVEREGLLLEDHFYRPVWRWTGDIMQDHRHFYAWEGIGLLGIGLGVHAVLANTTLDEQFRDYVQDQVVGDSDAFRFGRYLGEGWIVVPALAAVWIADGLIDRHSWLENHWYRDVDDWSSQSLRALLVGAPVTGVLQVAIGASRPGENAAGSRWRPFHDNNGVSGHAFVGAVPFLAAAKHSENVVLKSAFLLGSTLTGFSRIYEDKHYLSQALLGWWIAYLAVEATELTERSPLQYRLVPLGLDGVIGIGLEFRR